MTSTEFINEYVRNNTIVNCRTEECAIEFTRLADEYGFRLYRGGKYSDNNMWNLHGENVGYDLVGRRVVNIDSCTDHGNIIEYIK